MKNSGFSKDEFVYFLDIIRLLQNLIFNVGKTALNMALFFVT